MSTRAEQWARFADRLGDHLTGMGHRNDVVELWAPGHHLVRVMAFPALGLLEWSADGVADWISLGGVDGIPRNEAAECRAMAWAVVIHLRRCFPLLEPGMLLAEGFGPSGDRIAELGVPVFEPPDQGCLFEDE